MEPIYFFSFANCWRLSCSNLKFINPLKGSAVNLRSQAFYFLWSETLNWKFFLFPNKIYCMWIINTSISISDKQVIHWNSYRQLITSYKKITNHSKKYSQWSNNTLTESCAYAQRYDEWNKMLKWDANISVSHENTALRHLWKCEE